MVSLPTRRAMQVEVQSFENRTRLAERLNRERPAILYSHIVPTGRTMTFRVGAVQHATRNAIRVQRWDAERQAWGKLDTISTERYIRDLKEHEAPAAALNRDAGPQLQLGSNA